MLSIIFMIVARIKHCKLFFLFSADNFHDHFTYLTLWAVFLFSADFGNATVSTNSKQVGLRHSRGVNMFYFSGLSFRDTRGSEFFRSEFSRHPRVWVFRVWSLSFRGLSFWDTLAHNGDVTRQCKESYNVHVQKVHCWLVHEIWTYPSVWQEFVRHINLQLCFWGQFSDLRVHHLSSLIKPINWTQAN